MYTSPTEGRGNKCKIVLLNCIDVKRGGEVWLFWNNPVEEKIQANYLSLPKSDYRNLMFLQLFEHISRENLGEILPNLCNFFSDFQTLSTRDGSIVI